MKNTEEKAIELIRQGRSYAQVARELGTSKSRVGRWAAAARDAGKLPPRAGTGRPKGRKRPNKPKASSKATPAADAPAYRSRDDAIVEVDRRLTQVRNLLETASEEGNHSAYTQLIKVEASLRAERVALEPPRPPDPETDPMYVKARERLMDQRRRLRLRRLKEAAGIRDAMCEGCRRLFEGLFGGDLDAQLERASEGPS